MTETNWYSIVEDAGDGSGDAIIQIPQGLLAKQGWKAGDEFTLKLENLSLILMSVHQKQA